MCARAHVCLSLVLATFKVTFGSTTASPLKFNKTSHLTIALSCCVQVHKAGSSTIYNMLARYALSHDLNVALPELPFTGFCYHTFGPIKEEHVIPLAPGQTYHMLFSHMTYNRSVIERFMPRDSFYVAIMREPFQKFLSSSYYNGRLKPPAVNNTGNVAVKFFLRSMKESAKKQAACSKENSLFCSRLLSKMEGECRFQNSIVCDTGLQWSLQNDETAVKQHLKKLDQELDLMLVMEHFAESLVLFKRRAGLQLKDVLYFKANSRKNPNQHQILEEDVLEIKELEKGDYLAYEHFYPKFWEEVRKEGEDFRHEVSYFKDINERVEDYCSGGSEGDTLVVPTSEWNEEFTVRTRDCQLMKTDEMEMHHMLVQRTLERRTAAGYLETRKTVPRWNPTC